MVFVVVQQNWINSDVFFWPASSYITKVWHWVEVQSISPL